MAIPTALKKANEQSEELARKQGMRGVPGAEAPPAAPPTEPAAPRTAGLTLAEDAPSPPADPPAAPPTDSGIQARYDALQGKYNAEVPRLAAQVKELLANVETLSSQNQELKQQLAHAQQPAPDWAGYIPQLGESLGESNLSEVLEGLRNENVNLRNEIRERDQQIETLGHRVDGVESLSRRETETRMDRDKATFWQELNKAVPDYQQLNRDSQFVAFMYEPDPVARRFGRTDNPSRQDIMSERAAALDVDAVISIYNDFKQLRKQGSDARTETLQRQIGPDDSGAGGTHLRSDKEIMPMSYVRSFERDVLNGRYNGREEDRRRIDQAIFEAQKEGRIDPRR